MSWFREHRRLVALGGAVIALSVLGTLVDGPFPTSKMGVLGEWLAAFFTIVAVVLAIGADSRAESKREGDRRVADARSVIASDIAFRFSSPWTNELSIRIANYSLSPIREVRAVLDWTAETAPLVSASLKDGQPVRAPVESVWVDTLCAVLPPSGNRDPLGMNGARKIFRSARLTERDLRRYGLRFLDVHGDEWIAWFGPVYGTGSEVRRISNNSRFWSTWEDPPSTHDPTVTSPR